MLEEKKIDFTYKKGTLKDLTAEDHELLEKAKLARLNAHAPYSHFQVGAAALLADGTTVIGSNQENRSYPAGLCAERVCLFHASSNYPEVAIKKLAVVAIPEGSKQAEKAHPCGGCRQVMLEMEHKQKAPIELLLLYPNDEVVIIPKASLLMPFPFESEI